MFHILNIKAMKNLKMLSLALAAFFILSGSSLFAKENPRAMRKGQQAKFQEWAKENPKEAKRFDNLAKKHPEAAQWFYSEARKSPEAANQLYKEAKKNPLLAKSVYEASQKNNKFFSAKKGKKHPHQFKKYDKSKRGDTMKRGERVRGKRLKKDNRKEGRPHFQKEDRKADQEKE